MDQDKFGAASDEPGGGIWRERTWRCELPPVLGYPILRLYI